MRNIEDTINLTDGYLDPIIDRMEKDIDRLMRQVERLTDKSNRLLEVLDALVRKECGDMDQDRVNIMAAHQLIHEFEMEAKS